MTLAKKSDHIQNIDFMLGMVNGKMSGVKDGAGGEFDRVILFDACGTPCQIEWWCNIAYLRIGKAYTSYIPFDRVQVDTCWPSYNKGLKFFRDEKEVAYVATELLPWQIKARESQNLLDSGE